MCLKSKFGKCLINNICFKNIEYTVPTNQQVTEWDLIFSVKDS